MLWGTRTAATSLSSPSAMEERAEAKCCLACCHWSAAPAGDLGHAAQDGSGGVVRATCVVLLAHCFSRLHLSRSTSVHGLADLSTRVTHATAASAPTKPTISCRVACIIAWLAVLMVLNSPAPIRAVQLRANLTRVTRIQAVHARATQAAAAMRSELYMRRFSASATRRCASSSAPRVSRSAFSFSAAADSVTCSIMSSG